MEILTIEIPKFLETRSTWDNVLGGTLFIISFITLSVANLLRPGFYFVTTQLIFKLDGIIPFTKEFLPVNKRTSTLLYLNFIFSVFAINSLIVKSTGLKNDFGIWGGLFFVLFNICHLFSLMLTSLLAGQRKEFIESIFFKLTGLLWLGVAYFVIGVCWFFTPGLDEVFLWVVIILTLIEFLVRVIKSFFISFRSGASWYYIILYLCTLEILPILIILLLIGRV